MRTVRIAAILALGLMLPGCLAAAVVGTAVAITGTAVGVTAKGAGMAVGAVIPDGDDEKEKR